MGLDGGPAGEVYVELRLSPARMAVGDPTISPARFTGPWVAHRLKVNPATDLRPPTCWPWATSATRERAVMKANLSRFLHRRDEAYRPSSTDRVRSFGCSRGQTATGCPPAGAAGSGCRWPADRTPGCAGRMQLVHEVMAGRSSSRCLTNVVGDRHSDEPQPAEVAVRLGVLPLAWGTLGLPAVVGIGRVSGSRVQARHLDGTRRFGHIKGVLNRIAGSSGSRSRVGVGAFSGRWSRFRSSRRDVYPGSPARSGMGVTGL